MAGKGPVKRTIKGPDVLSSVILDTSNAERSLKNFMTKVNKSNKKLEIDVGIDALKDAKQIWDAMRSELSQHGETEIFKGLAETFDSAEKAFRNMKATLNGEEIKGFAKIIQSLSNTDLNNISKLDFGIPGLKNNILEIKKLEEATEKEIKSVQKLAKTRKKTAAENESYERQSIKSRLTKIKRQVSSVSNANLSFSIDTGDLNNIDAATKKLEKWADKLVTCRNELSELKKFGAEGMEDIFEEVDNAIENSLENINNKIVNATEMLRSAGAHNPNVSVDIGINAAKLKKQADATRELAEANRELNDAIAGDLSSGIANEQDKIIDAAKMAQDKLVDAIDKTADARQKEAKATEQAAEAKSKYYEINESTAKAAKNANSFSDYVPGSATKAYRQAVDELSSVVEEKKTQFPDKVEQLDRWLDAYAKRYAEYINKQNSIDASVPSVMIAGPDAVSQKQKNRQNERREVNYKFFEEKVKSLEEKIKNFGHGEDVIRTDDENAVEVLEKKIEDLKQAHQIMVEANKYFRKHKNLDGFEGLSESMRKQVEETRAAWGKPDMQPFPQYALQNSNAEIKRLEGRLKEIQGLKTADGLQEVNDIYSLVTDKKDMRIRISFEIGKPDQEVIDMLKGNAFKWSPKNNAWQRQLTDNAVAATKRLQKSLHEYFEIGEKSVTKEPVEQLTSSYEGLAEAVAKFHAVNQKTFTAYKNNSPDYQQLVQEREDAIAGIQNLLPAGTPQYLTIADKLKSSGLRDATGQDLVGFVESNLKKAISADAFTKFSNLLGKYSTSDADILFGSLPTINEDNIKEVYDQLVAKEKEYLESGAKSISAFKERKLFLEQSVELTEKLKDNEQLMQQRDNLLSAVTDGFHTSEDAIKILNEFVNTLSTSDVVKENEILISSYQDLYKILEKLVDLSKQLKPEWTEEFSKMQEDMDRLSFPDSKENLIAEINAQYDNVKRIKSSIKNGLSVYKYRDGSGYEAEYDINSKTLNEAEMTLRSYIYQAVEYFGYTVEDVLGDFDKKRIRAFVEDRINEYTSVRDKNNVYSAEAEAFNAPIKESIDRITSSIENIVVDEKNKHDVYDLLHDLSHRANDVNRYTLSSQSNYIGSLIGITTPYNEIKLNAKKIESYQELCDVVAEYNKLQEQAVIFGGTEYPGLNQDEEFKREELRERLKATGGQDIFKLSSFSGFRDIDKLATTLGIEIPKASNDAAQSIIEDTQKSIAAEQKLQQEVKETTNAIKEQAQSIQEVKNVGTDKQSLLIDENLKKFTRGVDIKSLFSGVTSEDMPEIKSEFYKIVELMQRYEQAKQDGIDTTDIINDINNMTVNIVDMITDSVYSATKKGEYIYQDFWEEMRGQHLQYDPEEYKKEFGDDFAEMIRGMAFGKHQKLFTKEQSPHAETADTLYERLEKKFGSIMLTRDDRKPNENNIYELFDAIVTTWRKAIDEHSLGAIREPVLTAPKDEFQADLYSKVAMVTAQIASNIEKAILSENELANAAEKAAAAKQKQLEITQKASSEISAEEIVARNMSEALEKLSSAKNNQTTLFNLKGVSDGDSLIEQAQSMVENIAEQANLSLSSFNVKDDTIKVKLYNDELKVTVDQMYKLRAAAEDAESATLELVSESFTQNVKALNENSFDTDGMQQRAIAAVEKVRSSLHGLEYDLTGLENAAKNITSKDDFTKFNNQLKATQDRIQAIKNATVSKSSMNQLANMQRDMKNANTELETMRIKLQKIGEIDGVDKAQNMISEMESAVKAFNEAQDAKGQQDAYSKYSDARSSFKVQLEYLNQVKQLNNSQSSSEKATDPIRDRYKSILDTVNKINSINSNILKYQDKDGGTGMFAGYIEQLQSEKVKLVSQLESISQEINSTLQDGFVQGTEYSIPSTKILQDDGAISNFLNDTRTQASLTADEIDKLIASLQKAQNIDVDAATKVVEQFKTVQDTYQKLSKLTTLDKNGDLYKTTANIFGQIMHQKELMSSDPTQWTPDQSANLQGLINKFNEYGNVLVQIGQKEARYFSNKTKYTKDLSADGVYQTATEDAKKLNDIQKQLEQAAKSFATESGSSDAFITNFTQGADGISRLDFSVFDNATNSMRNFRMEMGSVTDGMYVTETTVSKSLSNIQAAQKQLQSVGDLISRLGSSGFDVGSESSAPQIQKLLDMYRQLSSELNKGDSADQSLVSKLTMDSKLAAAEVEKLYKKHIQLNSAISNGDANKLGDINLNKDIYKQLTNSVNEYVRAHDGANAKIGKFNATTGQLKFSMEAADGTVKEFTVSLDRLGQQAVVQQSGVQELGSRWDQFKNSLSRTGKQFASALVGVNVFYKAISEVRKGYGYVKEIDLAMTELKKVTDETTLAYDNFLNTASKRAGAIGATVSDFTEATANFARLGYTMEESANMAETAIVYKNVADGLDTVEASTDSIISTMKAFGIESDNTMSIIDRFNEVGNNFAITSAGIGDALQRSASALFEAGNSIDESIALVTAANSVIQNPEQVGTALKTLALRLRGAKVELEEASLDTDNMAESTATLQAKLKALTHGKVDIMLDADTFKNTTQILREMSEAWEDMTDIERASALELMGGKRQANILASVIKNFDTVESVIETSMNSEGSALAENEKYLDSIQGKTDILTNSMQTLWNNALNSDFLKFLLDVANGLVKAADSAGLLNVAIAAFLAKSAFSSKGILNGAIQDLISDTDTLSGSIKNVFSSFDFAKLGANLLKGALTGLTSVLIGLVITKAIQFFYDLATAQERAAERANEAIDAYTEAQASLKKQKSTIDDISESYERLSKGVDLDTNKNINLTTASYEEYLDICNQIADMYPSLVTGYDAQGNAILSLKGNVDQLTQAYREAAQAARQKAIASGGDIFNSFKNTYDSDPSTTFGTTGLTQQIKLANKLRELINSGDQDKINRFFNDLNSGNVEIDGQKYSNVEFDDLVKEAGLDQSFYKNGFIRKSEIDIDAFKQQSSKIVSFIKSATTSINTETSKVKTLMDAYLGEDLDYASMSEKSRSFVSQIVSSLNAEFINGFDNADSLYGWIKSNVVDAFKDQSVVDAINDLSDLQIEFSDGDISYSDYQKQLTDSLGKIQNKFDENVLTQIKVGIGIDEESLQTAWNHTLSILGNNLDAVYPYMDKVASLSVEDLQIAGQLEIPEGTILSWAELTNEIKKAKIAATKDFDITNYTQAISAHSAIITEYQEALKKLDSGSFTMNDFMDLIEKYPDLAKGVDISSNAFYGLSRNLNRAIKSNTKSFIKDLKELKVSLVEAGKSTDSIDQLIEAIENMPDDALDDVIQKYSTLAQKIDEAKTSQDQLLASMEENPNEGYETRGEAMEYMKEAMKKGEIGSESNLWNVAEKYGFTYDSAKSINENADALANFIAIREKWFAQDDDGDDRTKDGYSYKGTESFIKDVKSAVDNNAELQKYLTWDYDESTGVLNFDYDNKNWDTIVSILSKTKELAGLTSAEFSDMMIQVGQYFNINWGDYNDVLDHLNSIATGTSDAKTKVEEYGKAMQDYFGENSTVDLTVRPMVKFDSTNFKEWEKLYQEIINNPDDHSEADVNNAKEQLASIQKGDSYATVYSSTFSTDDGSKSIVVTPILPDGTVLSPDQLEEYANKLLSGEEIDPNINIKLAEFDGSDSIKKADEYAQALHEAQAQYDTLRDTLGINAAIDKDGIEGLSKIEEIQRSIITKSDGTVVINKEAFKEALAGAEYTEDQIDVIVDKIQKLNEEAFDSDPFKIDETLIDDGLTGLKEIEKIKDSLKEDASTGLAVFDTDMFSSVLTEAGYTKDQIDALIKKVQEYNGVISTSSSTDPLGLNSANMSIDTLKASLNTLGIEFGEYYGKLGDGLKDIKINVPDLVSTLKANGWTNEAIKSYCAQLSQTNIEGFQVKVDPAEVDAAIAKANEIPEEKPINVEITGTAYTDAQNINSELNKMLDKTIEVTINETTIRKTKTEGSLWDFFTRTPDEGDGADANGTVHVQGTAHATGSFGATETETALVGELGPELLVRNGRWTTIGNNGAEFTQVKKGDIIFNHKQTEDLLSKGYVTGRGKLQGGLSAFASGTALASGGGTFGRYEFDGEGGWTEYDVNNKIVDSMDGAASALSEAADAISDSSEEFSEVFDWIEVRIEELDETLGLLESQIENAVYYNEKNTIIDDLINTNKIKLDNLEAGYKKYADYAAELLTKVPQEYHDAVKNGAISIEAFVGEVDEKTLEAIENYREWAQKAADFKQQANEILTTIRDLAIQKFDNAYESGDVRATVEDSQTEKLQNAVDYDEERGLITSDAYYVAMMENSNKKIEYLTEARKAMQKELNAAVEAGQIERGSNEWYELLDQMYQVDAQIDEATIELEEFQNAINDIYWDNFDQLISRIDYLKDETQSLIDLMSNEDLVVDPVKRKYENGTVEYWTADDVDWTDEGLASLGLYAQQMEISEYRARQYAKAIDDLTKEYKAGHYSENEYYEKLNELKDAQYESIEAYYDAQDSIKDLNETRIDSIKKGIDKEIEAYEELIKTKKELLNAEKDAHDFQKTVVEQQKNISDIERKLAALAYDNSISASAKRAQLEAELADARAELDETYYDRSIEEQQNALDKELENFQEEKDAEVIKMEEYLENIKQVVADSLLVVQGNASGIYDTLTGKAQEYNLTLSESIMTPWQDGSLAVSGYQETFDTAMSSTMDQLDALKNKWQEVIDKMVEAGNASVEAINKENANYAAATKPKPAATPSKPANTTTVKQETKSNERTEQDYYGVALATLYGSYGWGNGADRMRQYKEKGFDYDKAQGIVNQLWGEGLVHNGTWEGKYYGITKKDLDKYHYNKFANGTKGVSKDQLAIIDELGEELRLVPDGNGRLAYLSKGTSVIPADMTANLMEWGALDPADMLERNRPQIGASPSVINNTTEVHIDASVGELLHVEHLDGNNPAELTKVIDKAWDKRMKELNGYIRRYTNR